MAQFIVRNLEDDVKSRLKRRAERYGRSMEEEVRHILRNALRSENHPMQKLGTRIAARFAATKPPRGPEGRSQGALEHPHQRAVAPVLPVFGRGRFRCRDRRLPLNGGFMIKNGLPPIHPGVFLRELLEERRVTQAQFARAIGGVAPMRISHVVTGARPVTAELALLFGRALGQSPQYWLNLQSAYDLKLAERAIAKQLKGVSELQTS